MIQAQNLTYAIPGRTILDSVSFEIEAGDFIGLLGPNGSGKTTLLKALSGAIRNYSGSVRHKASELRDLTPKAIARAIAVVPQEANFALPFSALEVVLMGRFVHQKPFSFDSEEDLRIARQAMERCDCLSFAGQSIETLSGGEKQRVLVARALAQQTDVLLLDEPASHLDLRHQKELYALLNSLNQEDAKTIICVAHDVNSALAHCRKALLLKNGRLHFKGAVSDVLREKNLQQVFEIPFKSVALPSGKSHFFNE